MKRLVAKGFVVVKVGSEKVGSFKAGSELWLEAIGYRLEANATSSKILNE